MMMLTPAAAVRAVEHGVEHHVHYYAHHRRDDAHEDDARDEHTGVAVADMGELVAQHSRQLVVVERAQQSGGDGHGVALLVDARGKGVELRVVDDVYLGHIHVAGHAEVLHDIVYPRVLPPRERTGSRSGTHHRGVGEVGDEEPHAHDAHHPGSDGHEGAVDGVVVYLGSHIAIGVSGWRAHRLDDGEKHPHRGKDNQRERQQKQHAAQVVAPYLRHHTNILHRLRT